MGEPVGKASGLPGRCRFGEGRANLKSNQHLPPRPLRESTFDEVLHSLKDADLTAVRSLGENGFDQSV